jgi:hypothetical protein
VKAHAGKAPPRRIEDFGAAVGSKLGRSRAQGSPEKQQLAADIALQHKANEYSL